MNAASRLILTSALLFVSLAANAQAHFVWVVPPPSAQSAAVSISFAEGAEPGESDLIDKIAHTEAWTRTGAQGSSEQLKLEVVKSDKSASLNAAFTAQGPCSIEAHCDYGVVAKGEKQFLLQYYAKNIRASSATEFANLARAERLPLDIVPTIADEGISLHVLWNGKPAANAEVVAGFGKDDELTLKTDHDGRAELPLQTRTPYAVRARHVETENRGERDGKIYDQVRHYVTLTFAVPPDVESQVARAASVTSSSAASSSAAELLEQARQSRSVWNDFPGFSADVTLHHNNEVVRGVVSVNGDGDVGLKIPKSADADWLRTYLESMVQHRMPDGPSQEDVRFVDDADHPLGRKIALGDGEQASEYRIKGNVITEVNRRAGPGRFTISVLDVVWTADKRYLPTVFSITSWGADGNVQSNNSSQDSWVRVGKFDLPLRTMQVTTGKDSRDVRVIEFSNHRLK